MTPETNPSTTDLVADHLPLLPPAYQRNLVELINRLIPIPLGPTPNPTSTPESQSVDSSLPSLQRSTLRTREALVIWAQHRYESIPVDVNQEIRTILGLTPDDNPDLICDLILQSIKEADEGIPGTGWAGEPKRAIGLLLVYAATIPYADEDFWSQPSHLIIEGIPDAIPALRSTARTFWQVMKNAPDFARLAIDKFFDRECFAVSPEDNPEVYQVQQVLAEVETVGLLDPVTQEIPPPSKVWEKMHFQLRLIVFFLSLCVLSLMGTQVYIARIPHILPAFLVSVQSVIEACMQVSGWALAIGGVGFWLGWHFRSRLGRVPKKTVVRGFQIAVMCLAFLGALIMWVHGPAITFGVHLQTTTFVSTAIAHLWLGIPRSCTLMIFVISFLVGRSPAITYIAHQFTQTPTLAPQKNPAVLLQEAQRQVSAIKSTYQVTLRARVHRLYSLVAPYVDPDIGW